MIEVHIDIQAEDVISETGFPDGSPDPQTLYEDLLITLQSFSTPTVPRRYLVAIGLYLADNFEETSWRVVGFIGQTEVGRLEYVFPEDLEEVGAPKSERRPQVSRYQRKPVI